MECMFCQKKFPSTIYKDHLRWEEKYSKSCRLVLKDLVDIVDDTNAVNIITSLKCDFRATARRESELVAISLNEFEQI